MKIIQLSLVVLAVMVCSPLYSQKVTKKVTKEICQCFDKIDPAAPTASLKQESEACIMQGMMDNITGLMKEYKIKEGDTQGANKMGQDIGKKLVQECPSALNVFMRLGADDKEEEEEEEPAEEETE